MRTFWPSLFCFLGLLLYFFHQTYPRRIDAALAFVGVWFTVLLYIILVAVVGVIVFGAYIVWVKAQNARTRMEDGAYPLQRKRLRDGRTMYINPNMMIGAAAIVDRDGNYHEPEHPAGWAAVAAVRAAYEHTNGLRAMYPGDQARKNKWGAMSGTPRAGSMRQPKQHSLPALPAERRPALEDKRQQPPARPLTIYQGFKRNTGTLLAAGAIDAERVYQWDIEIDPHVRLHGATQGAGKTNLAKTLLAGALLRGHHAIVADRRRFKRFRGWEGKIEQIDSNDTDHLMALLHYLTEAYQRNDRAQAGGADIAEHVFVLFSEFGSLCKTLQRSGAYGEFATALGVLAREAGGAGVHLLFEDQVVEKGIWPADVVSNSLAMVGRMPSRGGQMVGYYHSDKLLPYSFYCGGDIFTTWNMDEYEGEVIARVRDRVQRADRGATGRSFGEEDEGVFTPVAHAERTPNERPVEPGTPDKQAAVWAWRDANPDATSQAQMRRDLLGHGIMISKGHASDCWNSWPGQAEPATGAEQLARLGVSWDEVEVKGRKVT